MTELALIGGGHAHAFVLESFARNPRPDVRLTLLSADARAPYSGCVPAWLAGEREFPAATLDLQYLADKAGAHLIVDPVVAIRAESRRITLESGKTLGFDIASFNVGATLAMPTIETASPPTWLPMRPLAHLHERWQALLEQVQSWPATAVPQRILAVGGGAAGAETLMAALARLRQLRPDIDWQGTLLGSSDVPLATAGRWPRYLLRRELDRAGIEWIGNRHGEALVAGGVRDRSGNHHAADIVIWATGARGHTWLEHCELPLTAQRFIETDDRLHVRGFENLFAAGDCAELHPVVPKAGVQAVRMGPTLAHNLRASAEKSASDLQSFRRRPHALALIGNGRGEALASRGILGARGRWIWRWKTKLDQAFLDRFNRIGRSRR